MGAGAQAISHGIFFYLYDTPFMGVILMMKDATRTFGILLA